MKFHSTNDSYTIRECLNVTSYFSVRECISENDGNQYRVKIYSKYNINRLMKEDDIKTEFKILREIDHPNLNHLKEIFEDADNFYIVSDYFSKYSISIKTTRADLSRLDRARKIFQQIVSFVQCMHNHGIVLRNIKPDMILVDDNDKIVFSDLSFATYSNEGELCSGYYGDSIYDPPEVLRKTPYDGRKADLWALGVILYLILSNDVPWHPNGDKSVLLTIQSTQLERPPSIPVLAFKLIQSILCIDQTRRITIDQILEHPWMNIQDETNEISEIPPQSSLSPKQEPPLSLNLSPKPVNSQSPKLGLNALPRLRNLPTPVNVQNDTTHTFRQSMQAQKNSPIRPFNVHRRYSLGEKPQLIKPNIRLPNLFEMNSENGV